MENDKYVESIKIDLGCGPSKKKGFKGMDIIPYPGVDYVVNLEEGFSFLPNDSVDEFYTSHFLEHVVNIELILAEIHRTLKPGGVCNIIVPHFSNPYFYSDYTHKRSFGLYSFDYFSRHDSGYRRKVPKYNGSIDFKVVSREIILKSPNFYITNLLKKYILNKIFNYNKYFQAVYEEYFTYIFPCYEMKFTLLPVK